MKYSKSTAIMSEKFERDLKRIASQEGVAMEDPNVRSVWLRFIREVVAPTSFEAGDRHRAEQYTMNEWLLHFKD